MSEVKWIKISTDVFDNRKIRLIESLPEGDALVVIWFKILTLAGNVNDGGYIYITEEIPYTEELLATQFNKPLPIIKLALATFKKFGMIDIVDDVIMVSNWNRYQNIEGMEKIREQNRIRKRNQRERERLGIKQKEVCHVTSRDSHATDIDIDIEEDKEKKNTKEPVVYFDNNPILDETFKDYLKMRKQIKKPASDRAIKLAISKLSKLSDGDDYVALEILNQSILNSWQDLYPIKGEKKSGTIDWSKV